MDCHMPGVDGYEATRRIRAAEAAEGRGVHVPIVAVTANAIRGDRELCIAAGMDAHLGKPFLRQDLHAILAPWLPQQQDSPVAVAREPIPEYELRRMFVADAQRLMDELGAALADGDHTAAVRAAHSLRSVSSHVEAAGLAQACSVLESQLRSGRANGQASALHGVRQQFNQAIAGFAGGPPTAAEMPGAAPGAASAETAPPVAESSPCALVVDDEPNDRFLIGRVLTGLGFRVEECDSGNEALNICRDHRPDLVVLDGILPGMDGVETCVALRAEKGLSGLPIIMVSGIQEESWRSRARAAGATAVVYKAVAARQLANDLGQAIAAVPGRGRAPGNPSALPG
jgi:CheY-like chemotaxis protein/HPt (histidine-containing phosphotransfer) domain-containing protein